LKIKQIIGLLLLNLASGFLGQAQSSIPKPKTREEIRAERRQGTLEERIERVLPVDVTLPKASIKLPGAAPISGVEDAKKYISETIPGLKKQGKAKIKKGKEAILSAKDVFDGKKYGDYSVQKNVYKRGTGARMVYMEYYTLKGTSRPLPFVREIFWVDTRTGKVVQALGRDRERYALLHGPYKEYVGEVLVKEGFYYLGARDGRWLEHDTKNILLDKTYWERGFLAESKKTYFDSTHLRLREVIPVHYGQETGMYYAFHESGTVALEGMMEDGVRIGKWVEYFPTGNRRKKEWQYEPDQTEPTLLREYNDRGQLIYEKK